MTMDRPVSQKDDVKHELNVIKRKDDSFIHCRFFKPSFWLY